MGARRRLSSSVAKTWPLFAIIAASAKVLPPAPAHRSSTCSPGFAAENNAASCEPSSCTSTRPLRNAGSAWIAGLFDSAARRMRRPQGDQRVGSGARSASIAAACVALALERVDAQVERRARGERGALLRALVAEGAGEGGIEPFRIIAGDMRRRGGEIAGREPRALVLAQRLRREARAVGELADRLGIEPALAPEHAEHGGARRLGAHQIRARGAPAQRVVDDARRSRRGRPSRRSGARDPTPSARRPRGGDPRRWRR